VKGFSFFFILSQISFILELFAFLPKSNLCVVLVFYAYYLRGSAAKKVL